MALDVQEKAQIVADYQQAVGDTGFMLPLSHRSHARWINKGT